MNIDLISAWLVLRVFVLGAGHYRQMQFPKLIGKYTFDALLCWI